jgi:hypothetical protein
VEQQHVVGPPLGEQVLDPPPDDVRGLVARHVHLEVTDLGVVQHRGQGLRIRRRREQVPQPLVFVLVARDDQGLSLAVH